MKDLRAYLDTDRELQGAREDMHAAQLRVKNLAIKRDRAIETVANTANVGKNVRERIFIVDRIAVRVAWNANSKPCVDTPTLTAFDDEGNVR